MTEQRRVHINMVRIRASNTPGQEMDKVRRDHNRVCETPENQKGTDGLRNLCLQYIVAQYLRDEQFWKQSCLYSKVQFSVIAQAKEQ